MRRKSSDFCSKCAKIIASLNQKISIVEGKLENPASFFDCKFFNSRFSLLIALRVFWIWRHRRSAFWCLMCISVTLAKVSWSLILRRVMFDIFLGCKKFFFNFYSKSMYLWAHIGSLGHHWAVLSCARSRESKRVISKNQRKQIYNYKSMLLFSGQTVYRQETGNF